VFVLGFITGLQGAMSKCDLVAGMGFLMMADSIALTACGELPFWGRLLCCLVAAPVLGLVIHKAGVLDAQYLGRIGEYPIVAVEAVLVGCLHLLTLLPRGKQQEETAPA
jgi:hypothetical protein